MVTYRSIALSYTMRLSTSMQIGTGYGLASLIDERTVRGPHALAPTDTRMPYVPGSSVKGRLRLHAEMLTPALFPQNGHDLCVDIFGSAQQPGRVFFSDAHLVRDDRRAIDHSVERSEDDKSGHYVEGALLPYFAIEERTRVALSPVRRTALPERLARFESASAGLRLAGVARGWIASDRAESALALLTLSARALTHLGGHKGRGLGAVVMDASPMIDGRDVDIVTLMERTQ